MATLGNGGANYNNANKDLMQQLVQKRAKEQNDAGYQQSETQRALQVYKDRQAQGLDTSAQQKYLTSNLGYTGALPSAQSTQVAGAANGGNQVAGAALSTVPTAQKTNSQSGNDMIEAIRKMVEAQQQNKNSFSYDANNDPQYQAALRSAQANAQTASGNMMADMNKRGLLNSTVTADRAGQIQQQAYQNVSDTLLPQLMQQAYQRYQDEQSQQQQNLANYFNLAQLYNSEDQRGIDNSNTRAGLTGYMEQTPEARQYVDAILKLKQQAETPGITAAERNQLSAQADQYRQVLANMGIDSSAYGSNVTANQASTVPAMQRTLQGQQIDTANKQQQWENDFSKEQFAYSQARDQIKDKQWQQQFDEDTRQFGLQYALNKQVQLGGLSLDQARLAMQQANQAADNARQNASLNWNKAMDVWKATGVAPSGISGVQAGTPYGGSSSSGSTASYSDLTKDIDSSIYLADGTDQYGNKTGKKVVTDPAALGDYIISTAGSESDARKLFQRYGLKWGG